MREIKPEDTLVIKSIDWPEEIMRKFWNSGTSSPKKQTSVVVLDMPLLDTCQGKDLTSTLIADIVLQLLIYVAQTEPEFTRQRQVEGITAAKAWGVQFVLSPMERPTEFESVYKSGELNSYQHAKRQFNLRLLTEYSSNGKQSPLLADEKSTRLVTTDRIPWFVQ